MENKIKKREKYYSRLEKQLETQANAIKNSMKMRLSMEAGFGNNAAWGMGNWGAASGAALQILNSFGGKNPYTGKDFNAEAYALAQASMNGTLEVSQGTDGKTIYKIDGKEQSYTKEQYEQAQQIINLANSGVSQKQAMVQQVQAQMENNISIWLDYQKEQLDAQQEWEMDLLAEEQNDYEMEKTCIESELEMIKERKQAIEQQLGEAIKDSAPKFGLA